MKIAIDISPLSSGHAGRGVGKYTENLIDALEKYENNNSYTYFTRKQKLPKNIDLVHIPYFDPFFLTLRFITGIPLIITVHDLIPIAYSTLFPRGIQGELKWQIQKLLLNRANLVITDSNASKKDIVHFTNYPGLNIRVIYLAPSDSYKPISEIKTFQRIQEKYQLPQKFLIYVGDVNRNKNILEMIKAFHDIKTKFGKTNNTDLKLVLVGKSFLNEELIEVREINSIIDTLSLNQEIIRTGYIEDQDLAVLYSHALGYIQASIAEGFGLPILEAMACGCPVVTTNLSSLSEIAGPSLISNSADSGNIAQQINKLMNLTFEKRNQISKDGIAWSKKFSWQTTARETVETYAEILDRK